MAQNSELDFGRVHFAIPTFPPECVVGEAIGVTSWIQGAGVEVGAGDIWELSA